LIQSARILPKRQNTVTLRAIHMKAEIHPTYFPEAKVTCACGNAFTVGSTVEEIRVELCSKCHPFYTGKQNLVDTAGRVERFEKLTAASKEKEASRGSKKVKQAKRAVQKAEKKAKKRSIEL